jgi:predicted  nucleic acid-binding Zn-ribbon protein
VLVQNNELVEILQERVRELEAEADTNRQQLDDAEQQLKDAQDANQYVASR